MPDVYRPCVLPTLPFALEAMNLCFCSMTSNAGQIFEVIVERIRQAIEEPYLLDAVEVHVGASLGVTAVPSG
ncbi:MAG: hypothetical protein ACYCQM_07325 [Acidithiobacillus sp.]